MVELKYFSHENARVFAEQVKLLIKKAQGDSSEAIKELSDLIGALPEDTDAKTVIEYAEKLVAAEEAARKAQIGDLGKVSEEEGAADQTVKGYVDAKVDALDATDNVSDTVAGVAVQVDEANGVVAKPVVTVADNTVTYTPASAATEDTEAVDRNLTVADATAVLKGDAIAPIKNYIDAVASEAGQDAKDLADRLDVLEGEGEGSVKKAAEDATAAAVAQLISDSEENKIDEHFDTLKEIADWILDSDENAAGLKAGERLNALEESVGSKAQAEVSHEATAEDVEAGKATEIGQKVVDSEATDASGLYKYIDDKSKAAEEGATLIVDDDNKSFVNGSTTYTMKINDDNTIGLYKYTKIAISLSPSTKQLEIDDTTTSVSATATVTGTNASTAEITWTNGTPATTTGTGTSSTMTIASATAKTLTAKADDGQTNASATCKVTWAPAVFWGADADGALEEFAPTAAANRSVQTGAAISNKVIAVPEGGGYIYYATSVAPGTFYLNPLGSATSGDRAALPGGMLNTGVTFKKYTSSEKTYTIYRSKDIQPAGNYRLDVV